MKKKSIAMLAISGLLAAASLAYVAPAMADDESEPELGQLQASSDTSMQPGNEGMQNAGVGSPTAESTPNNVGASNAATGTSEENSSGNTNSTGTPDTATGDDDY